MVRALAEKHEQTGLAGKERWSLCHKESSWQGRQSLLSQREKKQSNHRLPDREVGESQSELEPHLS